MDQQNLQSKILFPIDYSVELIQKELLTQFAVELKDLSACIHRLTDDIELIDKVLLLPEKILRSSIEKTLIYALNNREEYFVSYEDSTTE